MGGYLSAFYAMLTTSHREDTMASWFRALNLPGGLCRYMDDVAVALAYSTKQEATEIRTLVSKLASSDGYPPPLKLNLEEEGDQDFLEGRIRSHGARLWIEHRNDVIKDPIDDMKKLRLPDTRSRINQQDKQGLMANYFIRAIQLTSEPIRLPKCLIEATLEMMISGWDNRTIKQILYVILVIARKFDKPKLGDDTITLLERTAELIILCLTDGNKVWRRLHRALQGVVPYPHSNPIPHHKSKFGSTAA